MGGGIHDILFKRKYLVSTCQTSDYNSAYGLRVYRIQFNLNIKTTPFANFKDPGNILRHSYDMCAVDL